MTPTLTDSNMPTHLLIARTHLNTLNRSKMMSKISVSSLKFSSCYLFSDAWGLCTD